MFINLEAMLSTAGMGMVGEQNIFQKQKGAWEKLIAPVIYFGKYNIRKKSTEKF